ncbi:MAG: hypothetical protein WBM28_02380 [Burkholderiales bacterium]
MDSVTVMGLGYIGLPLVVEIGNQYLDIGFDRNAEKVAHYRNHEDSTGEVFSDELRAARKLTATTDTPRFAGTDFVPWVTVVADKRRTLRPRTRSTAQRTQRYALLSKKS